MPENLHIQTKFLTVNEDMEKNLIGSSRNIKSPPLQVFISLAFQFSEPADFITKAITFVI